MYWVYWAGGLVLAGIAALHLLLLRRPLAVSGHFTALTEAWRTPPSPAMSPAELRRALAKATAIQFGLPRSQEEAQTGEGPSLPRRTPSWIHVLFLLAIVSGALLSSALDGRLALTIALHGDIAAHLLGSGTAALPWLFGAGILVGFGTRMAGGCTSGHGLCGVSRLQPGSVATTGSFLLAAVVCAFVLEALR